MLSETIARVFSYWKHFREFKNIFVIKPIYNFKNSKIKVIRTPKLHENGFEKNLKFDTNLYYKLRDQDIFYNMKFMKMFLNFTQSPF